MNTSTRTMAGMTLAAAFIGLGTGPAFAEHPTGPTCMDIVWHVELLKSFPRIAAACQEVAVRDGKKFARFNAEVTNVDTEIVKVRFLNVAGDPGREFSIKPGAAARVVLEGKKVEYSKLHKGDRLTVWMPESQVGVISDPDDSAVSLIELR